MRRHLLLALDAGHDHRHALVAEVAELPIQALEVVEHRLALALLVEGQLGQQQGGAAGVLVADLRRHQDAVALLAWR